MPLTVITLKNSPPSLRGDLTKWMQEISTGVYVGNFNSKIRAELWKRIVESVGTGEATMSYAFRNEIGYNFETHNSTKIPMDFDGIPLVFTPIKKTETTDQKLGFSKAAVMRKSKRYSSKDTQNNSKNYVVIDLETTGLDPIDDRIIEIAAIKIGKETKEYTCFVKQEKELTQKIKKLTGISQIEIENGKEEKIAISELLEFIGKESILGYNVDFDISFINEALKRQKKTKIENKIYDVMKYAKDEKASLKNYKLETVLKEYGINEKVPHRAMKDAQIIQKLASKIKTLMDKL